MPKSVRNSCVIKVFGGVYMLSRCFLDCSAGVGVFVTGLSQISSFFSKTGPKFIHQGDHKTMLTVLWKVGMNDSVWKFLLIFRSASWIKTSRVEIQWSRNSMLHLNEHRFRKKKQTSITNYTTVVNLTRMASCSNKSKCNLHC